MTSYQNMPPHSRVWVYQSDRELKPEEISFLNQRTAEFIASWSAHKMPLSSFFEVRHNRFLILMVDEQQAAASGCSIDKSVAFIKEMGQHLNINFFDRFNFAYREGEQIKNCNREEFARLVNLRTITDDTIVFNNLVATKKELESSWEIKLKDSWHRDLVR